MMLTLITQYAVAPTKIMGVSNYFCLNNKVQPNVTNRESKPTFINAIKEEVIEVQISLAEKLESLTCG